MSPSQLQQLLTHDWPGNVRELENVAMRFALGLGVGTGSGTITSADAEDFSGGTLTEKVAGYEKRLIEQALMANDGSIKATYEQLGLARKTLYDKMKKYGLNDPGRAE